MTTLRDRVLNLKHRAARARLYLDVHEDASADEEMRLLALEAEALALEMAQADARHERTNAGGALADAEMSTDAEWGSGS